MKTKIFTVLSVFMFLPSIAFGAVNCGNPQTVNQIFLCFSTGNMGGLIPVLILVGVVTFLSGIVRFVGAGDNEEKRQAGRQVMIYGIIILFVMVSIWGFVNILQQSFFGKNYGIPNYLPKLMK